MSWSIRAVLARGAGTLADVADPAARGRGEIRIEGLHKAYPTHRGEVVAARSLDLTVQAGSFFTILGSSGSGKTTLLMLITGLVEPTAGEIYLDGEPITGVPAHRRGLSVVFQNYALFPHLSVAANVAFPLELRGTPRREVRARVARALELVRLEGYERRRPKELSGGQQQRVALARAIVFRPRVLLMDEPLGALDRRLREQMQIEIKQLQRELGLTVVYVTHDQEEALAMSDRLAIMRDGEIVQVGTGRELYEDPVNAFVAQFLGETNLVTGRVLGDAGTGETRVDHGNGLVTTARAASWASAGSEVTLSLRPEHVDVAPAGDERPLGGNEHPGTVESSTYLGDAVKYRISLAGRILTAKVTNRSGSPSLEAGQRVRVAWAPRHAVLVR